MLSLPYSFSSQRHTFYLYGLLALLFLFPFLNFARYAPLQDWWTHGLVLLAIGLVALTSIWHLPHTGSLCKASIFLFTLAVYVMVSGLTVGANGMAIRVTTGIFTGMGILAQFFKWQGEQDRQRLIQIVAWVIFIGSMLQVLIGLIQALGLAPFFKGWLLFDINDISGNIMGNIGQRNQYAHYLGWGLITGSYLYARGQLPLLITIPSLFCLATLMAWSHARLPIAYGLATATLAWIWYRRNSQDPIVKRLTCLLAVSVLCIAITQVLTAPINTFLQAMGFPANLTSGAERLFEEGFGARRRIEWSKAWYLFTQHPILGIGWDGYAARGLALEQEGGWPKFPESVLFTQTHNLFFQILVETGVIGTLLIITGIVLCLLPYFYRQHASPDNLMLIGLATITLGHSMFEFPLWYLPFLACFVLVLALSPSRAIHFPLRRRFRQLLLLLAACGFLTIFGLSSYYFFVLTDTKSNLQPTQAQTYIQKLAWISQDPFWAEDGKLAIANLIPIDKNHLQPKLALYQSLAIYRPYPIILTKLAVIQALNQQPLQAKTTIKYFIAAYPDFTPDLVDDLNRFQYPEMSPLITLAKQAATAYQHPQESLLKRRIATVMTAARPIAKTPLFE